MRKTGPSKTVVGLVTERAGGWCEHCGHHGAQIHHRIPRGMGGSRTERINQPSNLVLLCGDCHAEVESNRELGYAYGWLVHRQADPSSVAVKRFDGEWVFLDDEGNYVPVAPEPEGAAA